MKTEKEIRDALRKCNAGICNQDKCWRTGDMCYACECSTVDTLAWVLNKEIDFTSKDLVKG